MLTLFCCPITLGPTFLSLSFFKNLILVTQWSQDGCSISILHSHFKQDEEGRESDDKIRNKIFSKTPHKEENFQNSGIRSSAGILSRKIAKNDDNYFFKRPPPLEVFGNYLKGMLQMNFLELFIQENQINL